LDKIQWKSSGGFDLDDFLSGQKGSRKVLEKTRTPIKKIMPTLNEHQTPNGGWQFYQPETGWGIPARRKPGQPTPPNDISPVSITLSQLIGHIIKMRLKNPAITAKFKLSTNPEVVKAEALKFNNRRLGLNEENVPTPFRVNRSTSRSAEAGAAVDKKLDSMAGLKRAAAGTAVGLEWLGKGAKTVPQELAEKRAATCVACPKMVPGEWYVTAPAEIIKKSIEAWKTLTGNAEFKFETAQGDKLKSCDICKCLLTLKTFVPLEHIISKTSDEIMGEFPAACWIKRRDA